MIHSPSTNVSLPLVVIVFIVCNSLAAVVTTPTISGRLTTLANFLLSLLQSCSQGIGHATSASTRSSTSGR